MTLAVIPPIFEFWLTTGLLRLMAVLQADGYPARILNLMGSSFMVPTEVREASLAAFFIRAPADERFVGMRKLAEGHRVFFDGVVRRLAQEDSRVFLLSVFRTNADTTIEVTRRLKALRPDVRIVLGGPEVTENTSAFMHPWIDTLVTGFGESVIIPVVRGLLETSGNGRSGPEVVRGGAPGSVPPIDFTSIMPDLEEMCLDVPLLLNTGCPFRCGFCTDRAMYGRFRKGSISRFVNDVDGLVNLWSGSSRAASSPPIVHVCDSSLDADCEQLDELCGALIRKKWACRPRFTGLVTLHRPIGADMARRLYAAGFRTLEVGLESGSPQVRRSMQKPFDLDVVISGIRTLLDAEIEVAVTVIVGWPTETERDFHQTLSVVESVCREGVRFMVHPLVRLPLANDKGQSEGGLLWRDDGPAGDPETRCRRYLSFIEHFQGNHPVDAGLQRDLAIRWMLPSFPKHLVSDSAALPITSVLSGADIARRVLELLEKDFTLKVPRADGWSLNACASRANVAILSFVRPESGVDVTIQIGSRGSLGKEIYAQAADLDLLYRSAEGIESTAVISLVDEILDRINGGSDASLRPKP